MNRKRLFALLIALVLIATCLPALADWTYTEQKNEDGSTIIISTDENGVVRNKSYVNAEGLNYRYENYDSLGILEDYYLTEIGADDKIISSHYNEKGELQHANVHYQEGDVFINEYYDESRKLTGITRSFSEGETHVFEHYSPDKTMLYYERSYLIEFDTDLVERYSPEGVLLFYTKSSNDDESWIESKYTANDKLIEESGNISGVSFNREYTEAGVLTFDWMSGPDGMHENRYTEKGIPISEYESSGDSFLRKEYSSSGLLTFEEASNEEGKYQRYYRETGVLLEEQYTKTDGSSGYKLYDENGFLYEHFNEGENRQTVKTYAPNGDSSVLEQNEEGDWIEKSEYQNGNLLKKRVYSYNENGDLDGYTITDANGQVISYTVYSLSEAGEETGFETYNQAGDLIASYVYTDSGPVGWEMDYEGNKISESYDGNVHIVEVVTPDGTITTTRGLMDETGAYTTMETLENGELVSISTYGERNPETNLPDEMIKTDLEGNVLETTLWIKDDNGNTLRTTTNASGKVIEQRVLGPDKEYLGGFKLTDTGMEKYAYNPILDTITTEVYDAAGNLVSVIVTDGVTVISKQDFEVAAKPQIRYVWYPNNTASTMGIAFRDVKPELTKKWYNFTPVDLSKDGEQTIPLIGGGMYIIGQVQVAVKGDEVTVTYTMRGDDRDTARRQSEFFTFFGSLNDVSAVEPEDIGAGFKFGEPLSIEKDLNGDTQVLLFVRNVVTFRDYYTNDRQLTRYWPNHPRYKEYRQQLETIMD